MNIVNPLKANRKVATNVDAHQEGRSESEHSGTGSDEVNYGFVEGVIFYTFSGQASFRKRRRFDRQFVSDFR